MRCVFQIGDFVGVMQKNDGATRIFIEDLSTEESQ